MSPFVARIRRDVVVVSGPDAVTWLQGQLSQDVAGLPVGGAAPTFVLSPQGKVAGWGRVARPADDVLRIDVDPGAGPAWIARLERFKLRTKADLALHEGVEAVAVRGLADVPRGVEVPPVALCPIAWPDSTGFDVIDPGPELTAALVGAVVAGGGVEVGPAGYDGLRIRAGVPRWGAEIDDDTIPASLGQWAVDASVSFRKGCYTGQELVARIDSRGGHVPRRLAVVALDGGPDGGEPPAPGAEVIAADGTSIGPLTSVAADPVEPARVVGLVSVPRAIELPVDVRVLERAGRAQLAG